MTSQADFKKFLSDIEPSPSTVQYVSSIHTNLRDYLANHEAYKYICDETFLSGSYAKHTSIRPKLNDGKRDVDIAVVTKYTDKDNPNLVIDELTTVMREKDAYKNARVQSHSVGIELSGIDVDVVPLIKDGDGHFYVGTYNGGWNLTDPKGHIAWSSKVNNINNGKYKPIIKIIKWWRRMHCPEGTKYPKGITLEKIIADCICASDECIEECLVATMKNIVDTYQNGIDLGMLPSVLDPCISDNNLLAKYTISDFSSFINKLSSHILLLEKDGQTNESWRTILGENFPAASTNKNISRLNYRDTEDFIEDLFPVNLSYRVELDCEVSQNGFRTFWLRGNNDLLLRHNKKLDFSITDCNVPKPYSIYWKVRNVGEVAESRDCIRGQIIRTDQTHQKEHTDFCGPHYVECYIIKNDICVARAKIDVPIGSF